MFLGIPDERTGLLGIDVIEEILHERFNIVEITRKQRYLNKIPDPFKKMVTECDITMEEKSIEDYKNKRFITRLENKEFTNVAIFAGNFFIYLLKMIFKLNLIMYFILT